MPESENYLIGFSKERWRMTMQTNDIPHNNK